MVTALSGNPVHFNRNLSTDLSVWAVGSTIYETLVRLDGDYRASPGLAESWESNSDATRFTFALRHGVRWQDGQDFTAADVKFTLEKFAPLSPAAASYARTISAVTTPDDHTVVVELSTPYAPLLSALAGVWIMPEHVFGDGQDLATHPANLRPVGTGPFRFDSFEAGQRVVVTRNDDYWGGAPRMDRILFQILPDANARLLALESGDLDYIVGAFIDKAVYGRLQGTGHFDLIPTLGGASTSTVHVNTTNRYLADPNVRRAVYQAVNRQEIADKAYYGFASPSRGPIPAAITWAVSDEVDFNRDLGFDPAEAGRLLDGSGLVPGPDGTRFTLRLAYSSTNPSTAGAAGVIASNLAQVGIRVEQEAMEMQVWSDRTFARGDYDLSMNTYTSNEDPSIGVSRLYLCNPQRVTFRNPSGLCDEALDQDFAQASRTADLDARRAAFAAAERRVETDLHNYPLVVEQQFYIGRSDRWSLGAAHATSPVQWARVAPVDG